MYVKSSVSILWGNNGLVNGAGTIDYPPGRKPKRTSSHYIKKN